MFTKLPRGEFRNLGSLEKTIEYTAPQRITFNYSLQGYEKGVPNIISTVLEDKEGNILAGIVDGGLAIKRKGADSFSLFKHNPGDPHSLAHNNKTTDIKRSTSN